MAWQSRRDVHSVTFLVAQLLILMNHVKLVYVAHSLYAFRCSTVVT